LLSTFELVSASILTICIIFFFLVNLWNLWRTQWEKKTKEYFAEHPHPYGLIYGVAAFGTLVFWIQCILYPFFVFTGVMQWFKVSPLQLHFSYDFVLHWLGLSLLVFGFFLFSWSVIARGRFATSWEMAENHKLVTWGPYRFIRHPSYLSYFLMFFGIFFVWLNLLAIIPLFAIPGYIRIVEEEEQLLIKRFGEQYIQYRKITGRFFPRIKSVVKENK